MIIHYQLNTRPDKGLNCAPNKRGDKTPFIYQNTLLELPKTAPYIGCHELKVNKLKVNIWNVLEQPTQSSLTTINLRNYYMLLYGVGMYNTTVSTNWSKHCGVNYYLRGKNITGHML